MAEDGDDGTHANADGLKRHLDGRRIDEAESDWCPWRCWILGNWELPEFHPPLGARVRKTWMIGNMRRSPMVGCF